MSEPKDIGATAGQGKENVKANLGGLVVGPRSGTGGHGTENVEANKHTPTREPLKKVTELTAYVLRSECEEGTYFSACLDANNEHLQRAWDNKDLAMLSPVPVGTKGRWRITVEAWPEE